MRKKYLQSRSKSDVELWEDHFSEDSIKDYHAEDLTKHEVYRFLSRYLPSSGHVIEAGCGFAQWVSFLETRGFCVTGLDFSRKLLRAALSVSPHLKLVAGNVIHLPFSKDSFDVCLSFGVVEHFEEGPEAALREAHRILKPGGLLVLTVPYLNWVRWLQMAVEREPDEAESINGSMFYEYEMSRREIVRILDQMGFDILFTRTIGTYWGLRRLWKSTFKPFRGMLDSFNSRKHNGKAAYSEHKSLRRFVGNRPVLRKFAYFLLAKLHWVCPHMILSISRAIK